MQINKDYDFILEINLFEVGHALIKSIKREPFFMEIKFNLIDKLIDIMNFSMIE